MKKLFTILAIALTFQCVAQDLDSAYKEYCVEGVKMVVDTTTESGRVDINIEITDGIAIYTPIDTTWYGNGMISFGNISGGYSCMNSMISIGYQEPPKKHITKTSFSKPTMSISVDISREKYVTYYYKKQKQSFEDWLKSKSYLK